MAADMSEKKCRHFCSDIDTGASDNVVLVYIILQQIVCIPILCGNSNNVW